MTIPDDEHRTLTLTIGPRRAKSAASAPPTSNSADSAASYDEVNALLGPDPVLETLSEGDGLRQATRRGPRKTRRRLVLHSATVSPIAACSEDDSDSDVDMSIDFGARDSIDIPTRATSTVVSSQPSSSSANFLSRSTASSEGLSSAGPVAGNSAEPVVVSAAPPTTTIGPPSSATSSSAMPDNSAPSKESSSAGASEVDEGSSPAKSPPRTSSSLRAPPRGKEQSSLARGRSPPRPPSTSRRFQKSKRRASSAARKRSKPAKRSMHATQRSRPAAPTISSVTISSAMTNGSAPTQPGLAGLAASSAGKALAKVTRSPNSAGATNGSVLPPVLRLPLSKLRTRALQAVTRLSHDSPDESAAQVTVPSLWIWALLETHLEISDWPSSVGGRW
ncbi:unnamed protein product [Phytophthora lilii]|uniref:Unnamed protein product n=1 Tax=Phytophthora lilii TaxID=2077276 RepID=A0A9W6X8D5_9STRA|nr:unnamed protein product [Phytophthora lilii]